MLDAEAIDVGTLSERLPLSVDVWRLDVVAAFAGLGLAVLAFPLRFLAADEFIASIPVVLGVACGLHIYVRRTGSESFTLPRIPVWSSQVLASAAFFGIGAMGLVASWADGRTLPFLLLGGFVTSLVLVQILFTQQSALDVRLLLVQILAIAFVVRFAGLLTTPGFVGVDIWSHVNEYARPIMEAGSLEPISDDKYYMAPLYHVLVVATAEALGTSLRTALFLSMGAIMALSTLLLYGTARFFVPARWALFAAAIFAVADWVVQWGIHLIPTSLGLVFFLGIIYGLARLFYVDDDRRSYAFLVALLVGVVFTHQVSAFIVLVLLGCGVFVQVLLAIADRGSRFGNWLPDGRDEHPGLVGLFAFDLVLTLAVWSVTPLGGQTFFERVLSWFVSSTTSSFGFLNLPTSSVAGGGGAGSEALATFVTYLDAMGFLLLLFLVIVGSLASLRSRQFDPLKLTLIVATVAMLVVIFALPLFGLRFFIPSRWTAFAYVPMLLIGVVGLYHLVRAGPRRPATVVLVAFLLVTPTVMLVSGNGTIDQPVFETENTRYSYTETELDGVRQIGALLPNESGPVYADHPFRTVINRSGAHDSSVIRLTNEGQPVQHDRMVYRTYQSDGAAQFWLGEENLKAQFDREEICKPGMNRVFTNGDVLYCTNPE